VARLAEQAEARIGAAVEPSPYLRDRSSVERVLDRLAHALPGGTALADTAQLLGFTQLSATARLSAAGTLLAEGRATAALAAAARAEHDFARVGDPERARHAAAVARQAEVADG
jgi:hypothetical protein